MATLSLIPPMRISPLALALAPSCSGDASSFQCRLLSVLNLLYVLGAVLALILVVVVAFCIRAWRAGRQDPQIPLPKPARENRHAREPRHD